MLGRFFNTITDLPWVQKFDQDIDTSPATWAGKNVTLESAQQLLVVYGCTAFHADHCSTMPIDVYRKLPDGSRVELATPTWLEEPSIGLDITDVLGQMWWSYWLGGHALALITYDSRGFANGFLPIHPDEFEIRNENQRPVLRINGKRYGGRYISIPHTLMPGSFRGVNPIEAARQTIGVGLAAAEFGATFFGRGQTMSGVLEFPGAPPGNEDLKLIRNSWVRTYGGSNRAHLPGLLFGGATWKPISIPPEQAQFLQTRSFTDAQIAAQLFQVPPSRMGIAMTSSGTMEYANITDNWAEMVRRWIPHLYRFKRAISKVLPRPQYIEFNVDRYLAADTKTRYETHKIGVDGGWLQIDEVRVIENLPSLKGGEQAPPPEEAA